MGTGPRHYGRKKHPEKETYSEYQMSDYEEDDDSECIDVEDAADIWMSSGKDEDYMFGYTQEELEAAL